MVVMTGYYANLTRSVKSSDLYHLSSYIRSEIWNALFNMLFPCVLPPSNLTHPNHISCSHCFKCPRCSSLLSVQQYLVCPEDGGETETTPAADKGRTLKNVGSRHV